MHSQPDICRDSGGARACIIAATLVVLAMMVFAPLVSDANSAQRSLTVDDLLKLADVGRATVRPGSNTFVWEQSPPYDTLSDYGAGTWNLAGSDFDIFTVDLNSTAPSKLFPPQARTTYRLGSFSRDGRFLTLLAMRDGMVKLAVYDFQRHLLKEYPLAPRFPVSNQTLIGHGSTIAASPSRHIRRRRSWPLTFRSGLGARGR